MSAAARMVGMLLFSITGFALNHAAWIAAKPTVTTRTAELPAALLAGLRSAGQIERIDWVFSRDQPERRHVQDRIREYADVIRRWVSEGAAIYVCAACTAWRPAPMPH